jgi:hypothetical protein
MAKTRWFVSDFSVAFFEFQMENLINDFRGFTQ